MGAGVGGAVNGSSVATGVGTGTGTGSGTEMSGGLFGGLAAYAPSGGTGVHGVSIGTQHGSYGLQGGVRSGDHSGAHRGLSGFVFGGLDLNVLRGLPGGSSVPNAAPGTGTDVRGLSSYASASAPAPLTSTATVAATPTVTISLDVQCYLFSADQTDVIRVVSSFWGDQSRAMCRSTTSQDLWALTVEVPLSLARFPYKYIAVSRDGSQWRESGPTRVVVFGAGAGIGMTSPSSLSRSDIFDKGVPMERESIASF